jgi:hypothetical protein
MKNEFIPYQQALQLKELGFDEPCVYYVDEKDNGYIYNFESHPNEFIKHCCNLDINVIKTPLYQQAFKWMREKHQIEAIVSCFYNKKLDISYEERQYHCYIVRDGINTKGPKFKTYEEAESACLDKLIEIVKNKSSL